MGTRLLRILGLALGLSILGGGTYAASAHAASAPSRTVTAAPSHGWGVAFAGGNVFRTSVNQAQTQDPACANQPADPNETAAEDPNDTDNIQDQSTANDATENPNDTDSVQDQTTADDGTENANDPDTIECGDQNSTDSGTAATGQNLSASMTSAPADATAAQTQTDQSTSDQGTADGQGEVADQGTENESASESENQNDDQSVDGVDLQQEGEHEGENAG
jgi:hypothetical protein